MAALTPAGRDRYVDLLRALSIGAVVLGHWLIATLVREGGELEPVNALAELSALRPVTWLFQVMPLFFVVGGFANHLALSRPAAERATAAFYGRRVERLLRPTLVFVGVWLGVAAVLDALPIEEDVLAAVVRVAAQPLWFLAVYLLVILLAPLELRVHRRRPWLLLAVLAAVAVVLDLARFHGIASWLAVANYLAVFLVAQELGFLYAGGRLASVGTVTWLGVAAAGFGTLAVLTTLGPYPVSMVGVPGEGVSNMSPPTVCILVLTVAQLGLAMALRPGAERWLAKPGPWAATVTFNGVIMTVFLWHLAAFVAAGALLVALGVSLPAVGAAGWWVQRVWWLVLALVALAGFVLAFSAVERRPSRRFVPPPTWRAALGVVLAARALAGLALSGFAHLLDASGRPLLGLRLSPLVDLALLVAAWFLTLGRLDRSGTAEVSR